MALKDFFKTVKHEIVEGYQSFSTPFLKVFPKYFSTDAQAKAYAKQPDKIANYVYANRMGNGDEATFSQVYVFGHLEPHLFMIDEFYDDEISGWRIPLELFELADEPTP